MFCHHKNDKLLYIEYYVGGFGKWLKSIEYNGQIPVY